MSLLPRCFGYVNENKEVLDREGIKYRQDCKTCPILEDCVAYYNARSYGGPWENEFEDDESEGELSPFEFEG